MGKEKEQYIKVYCVRIYHHYHYHLTNGLFVWQRMDIRGKKWLLSSCHS